VPEYILDEDGHKMQFKIDRDGALFLKDGSTYNPEHDVSEKYLRSNSSPIEWGLYASVAPGIKTPE